MLKERDDTKSMPKTQFVYVRFPLAFHVEVVVVRLGLMRKRTSKVTTTVIRTMPGLTMMIMMMMMMNPAEAL
jgi:hypothetical protein